jgi:spore coat polysaccharide biosynthesis predicted glycosyltransferase SpsG
MRCLTLAHTLSGQNFTITFLCKPHEGNLIYAIENAHFKVITLPPAISSNTSLLGCNQRDDAEDCINAIEKIAPYDLIIIDHYAIDVEWQHRLKPFCRKFFVIDDLADRKHQADFLLDQTVNRTKDTYQALAM